MNWIEVFRITAFALAYVAGHYIGGARMRGRILSGKAPKASKREDEMVIMHEGMIDGDALRLTLRTRSRIASFLVPREIVYHMSDDLLRSAAQLGRRESAQRGPES